MAALTDDMAKPCLDFAGKFRIIDFALSNLVNSGFRRIAVLTQYNSHRLLEHLRFGWSDLPNKLNEWIHAWPAQQSQSNQTWYQGTADALYQNLASLRDLNPEHVLVVAGDHVYKMDYKFMLQDHLDTQADLTIACMEVPRQAATSFGVAGVSEDDRIHFWVEKSPDPPGLPGKPNCSFASMGIYLFKAEFLFDMLERDALDRDSHHDFGMDLIPYLVPRARVFAHRFERSCVQNPRQPGLYWRDVGTVDAYWKANLDLTEANPVLDLYDGSWPIHTHLESLPPAKFFHDDLFRRGVTYNSLVSAGCVVSGADIHRSVLFQKVRVHPYALLDEAVVLPGSDIGEKARLRRVVVAPKTRIPPDLVVGEDPELDAQRFYRSPGGVTIVSQGMLNRL
jgi:glucose-1-phosphate adenylyltransferase